MNPTYVMAGRAAMKVLRDDGESTSGDAMSDCFAAMLRELWRAARKELDDEHADRLCRLVLQQTEQKFDVAKAEN